MPKLRRSTSADNRRNLINESDGQCEAEAICSNCEDSPQEGNSFRIYSEVISYVVSADSLLRMLLNASNESLSSFNQRFHGFFSMKMTAKTFQHFY